MVSNDIHVKNQTIFFFFQHAPPKKHRRWKFFYGLRSLTDFYPIDIHQRPQLIVKAMYNTACMHGLQTRVIQVY